ncbi:MAG TPA: 2,4'-dihydroxyacetophenone dioxygenase family protein [Mycobacteriales bacterium]|jgi:quercetin dioxygenase-like cupin family protein|nr:2,4'-dihydroxyacetophenone dioxygenase family protein [Mycobacteriales bacterium]
MTMTAPRPLAIHIGADELPFVDYGGGNMMKVLLIDEAESLWIVENIFKAGFETQTHRHTGPVFGYTVSGAWKYKEYDYVNRAGSFLYEPANSVHTLEILEDNTQVWFQMYGMNLNLREDGSVESVTDGAGTLGAYLHLAEKQGHGRPNVLVL